MNRLVLCIKLDNFVAHMFNACSFIPNAAVPNNINKNNESIP